MTLATEPQVSGVHARVADAFAPADERRGAYLKLLVTKGGTCRGCGANVNDEMLEAHPGVCGTCHHKKGIEPDPELLRQLAELNQPKPAERTETMARGIMATPRTCCDSKGTRHKAWCKEAGGSGKPPGGKPSLPPRPAKVEKPAARRVRRLTEAAGLDLKSVSVEQLVATIESCKGELARREEAMAKGLETLRAARAAA